jgi:hypothetical protein
MSAEVGDKDERCSLSQQLGRKQKTGKNCVDEIAFVRGKILLRGP